MDVLAIAEMKLMGESAFLRKPSVIGRESVGHSGMAVDAPSKIVEVLVFRCAGKEEGGSA